MTTNIELLHNLSKMSKIELQFAQNQTDNQKFKKFIQNIIDIRFSEK